MDRGEEFNQLRLRFTDPLQHDYEVIRPVVLFSQPISERSRETEMERTTVSEKARRFITEGMLGLVDQCKEHSGRQGHEYPSNGRVQPRCGAQQSNVGCDPVLGGLVYTL